MLLLLAGFRFILGKVSVVVSLDAMLCLVLSQKNTHDISLHVHRQTALHYLYTFIYLYNSCTLTASFCSRLLADNTRQ